MWRNELHRNMAANGDKHIPDGMHGAFKKGDGGGGNCEATTVLHVAILSPQQAWDTPVPLGRLRTTEMMPSCTL